jgi:hypothetical protein
MDPDPRPRLRAARMNQESRPLHVSGLGRMSTFLGSISRLSKSVLGNSKYASVKRVLKGGV